MSYNAPVPVDITLDGEFADWGGVPQMTLPPDADLTTNDPAVSFAAATDDTNLYLYANVIDDEIISGEHGENYWNEDSVEFYINATGNLDAPSYTDGIAQITIPALNIANPDQPVISGVRGDTTDANLVAIRTETGWAVEVALPLQNDVWNIDTSDGEVIGFQVHLNGASNRDRDTKLIWSTADTADTSYQNPSVFGELVFRAVE